MLCDSGDLGDHLGISTGAEHLWHPFWLHRVNTWMGRRAMTKVLGAWHRVPFSIPAPHLHGQPCGDGTHPAHREAVGDTLVVFTLMGLWRKTGEVWLKPKPTWVAEAAAANQPIQKVGLTGAHSHHGPEGTWMPCQVSGCRTITHCFSNWVMSAAEGRYIRTTHSCTPDGCFLFTSLLL